MAPAGARQRTWWGEFQLSPGETREWRIGPLRLAVARERREWQLRYHWLELPPEAEVSWSIGEETSLPAYDYEERFVFRETTERLRLRPALADRPVITRPLTPFHLPTGEEATLFLGTPLWVELAAGEPIYKLAEIPVQRPSDTWFGASTREGELCYATRTHGRLRREEMAYRPHRATTRAVIRNRGKDPLHLERINLPVPYLPLYESEEGWIWTSSVTMVREPEADKATLKIEERLPAEIAGARKLAPPREKAGKGVLIRALGTLFG